MMIWMNNKEAAGSGNGQKQGQYKSFIGYLCKNNQTQPNLIKNLTWNSNYFPSKC